MFAIDMTIIGCDSNIIYYRDTYTLIKVENTNRPPAITTTVILFIAVII